MPTHPDSLESIILGKPNGVSLGEIREVITAQELQPIPDRTLRRRLTDLINKGRIRREGKGRGTRYFPKAAKGAPHDSAELEVSRDGEGIREHVRQHLSKRMPVGYNEQFIREYRPGQSWYLDSSARNHLQGVGAVVGPSEPAGTFARQIFERLLIDLAWSSSRLEGNTYSRLDTENLLERGEKAVGKDARETQMILNHKKAIEMLVDGAPDIGFNRYTLLNLHAALSENLLDDLSDEGRVRRRQVGITGTTFIPLSIPQKLDELFDVLLTTADAIPDPFEQAFFVMVHLPYLQPFIDVNKRTSRLAANIPFIKHNLCPLSFVDVPERTYVEATLGVYELNRVELLRDLFVWAYERSAIRYRIVRDSVPEPNPVRLRYRQQLSHLVQAVIRTPEKEAELTLAASLDALDIPREEHDAFAALARSTLNTLHDGVIARYGLRPDEFRRWLYNRRPQSSAQQ